jgi:ketopantoate reductase
VPLPYEKARREGIHRILRFLVRGAGAVGGCFGALLAQAGRDVTFIVRRGRRKQLERSGLRYYKQSQLHPFSVHLQTGLSHCPLLGKAGPFSSK